MREERRMILSLVAAGRISAAEAERLIVAWAADREFLWLAVAGAALLAAQGVFHAAGIDHLAQMMAPGCRWAAQQAIAMWEKGLGGLR